MSWNELRDNTITTHRATSSADGGCFSLSCPMESDINLTFGLRNALSGRSLGLRVVPELRVTFRLQDADGCVGVLVRLTAG